MTRFALECEGSISDLAFNPCKIGKSKSFNAGRRDPKFLENCARYNRVNRSLIDKKLKLAGASRIGWIADGHSNVGETHRFLQGRQGQAKNITTPEVLLP